MTNCELMPKEIIAFACENIRKTCAGRKCLDECLRRVTGYALAPSPCGGGWGRSRLRALYVPGNIVRAFLRMIRRSVSFALFAACSMLGFVCLGADDVECYWENGVFRCDGAGGETIYGETVVVNGGMSGNATNGVTVITNIWGCCTNCVNMTPEEVEEIRGLIKSFNSEIASLSEAISVANYNIYVASSNIVADGDKMIDFVYQSQAAQAVFVITNFISQCTGTSDFSSSQCDIVSSVYDSWVQTSATPNAKARYASAAGHALFDYYNSTVRPYAENARTYSTSIANSNTDIADAVKFVDSFADRLSSDACPSGNCPTNWPSGGDGGQATGNWCTYEQGEAIKEWLRKQEDWLKKTNIQLNGIYNTLTHGLYSEYTHIPENADWRSIYLTGNRTFWGYDPTNTLQRIEMLLYGLVMTNGSSASFSDVYDSTSDETKLHSLSNDSVVTWNDFANATTNFSPVISPSQGLYQALRRLINSFSPREADFEGGEVLIGSASIGDGENSVVVPAITLGTSENNGGGLVTFVRTVKGFLHVFLSCFYILVGACVVWQCWGYFVDWALRFSHWGIELVSQIFS